MDALGAAPTKFRELPTIVGKMLWLTLVITMLARLARRLSNLAAKVRLSNLFSLHSLTVIYGEQGRNHGKNLGATSAMVGRICPPWLQLST